jgi:hypothetical protein
MEEGGGGEGEEAFEREQETLDKKDILISGLEALKEAKKQDAENMDFTTQNPWYLSYLVNLELATVLEKDQKYEEAFQALVIGNQSFELNGRAKLRMANWAAIVSDSEKSLNAVIKILKSSIKLLPFLENLKNVPRLAQLEIKKELEAIQSCKDKLALILAQKGLDREANLMMKPCTHRLSSQVLDYTQYSGTMPNSRNPIGRIFDHVLDDDLLLRLQKFFQVKSLFWTCHEYNEYQSNGYFSYVFQLDQSPRNLIEQTILETFKLLQREFPELASKIKVAEWWAHARPHSLGHQLHYDSENEGQGKVRHPLLSSVLYLSGEVGGPTLLTNQKLGGDLADKGWMIFPKVNRLGVFDANHLHGVIPGKGVTKSIHDRRITFMIGFWDEITVRNEDGIGASRPFPQNAPWIEEIPINTSIQPLRGDHASDPISIETVWESTDSKAAILEMDLPPYNMCFQGF